MIFSEIYPNTKKYSGIDLVPSQTINTNPKLTMKTVERCPACPITFEKVSVSVSVSTKRSHVFSKHLLRS